MRNLQWWSRRFKMDLTLAKLLPVGFTVLFLKVNPCSPLVLQSWTSMSHDGYSGDRITVPKVVAGNIAAITGIRSAAAGVTLLVTRTLLHSKRFDTTQTLLLPLLLNRRAWRTFQSSLRPPLISKFDVSLQVTTNQTWEALLAGMGELHLEIHSVSNWGRKNIKVRSVLQLLSIEGIQGSNRDGRIEGKSPNRHNRFPKLKPCLMTSSTHYETRPRCGPVRSSDAKETGNKFATWHGQRSMKRSTQLMEPTFLSTRKVTKDSTNRESIIEAFNEVCKKANRWWICSRYVCPT